MKRLNVTITEVENGYVVHEDKPGYDNACFPNRRRWVASSIPLLQGVIEDLALEALEEADEDKNHE